MLLHQTSTENSTAGAEISTDSNENNTAGAEISTDSSENNTAGAEISTDSSENSTEECPSSYSSLETSQSQNSTVDGEANTDDSEISTELSENCTEATETAFDKDAQACENSSSTSQTSGKDFYDCGSTGNRCDGHVIRNEYKQKQSMHACGAGTHVQVRSIHSKAFTPSSSFKNSQTPHDDVMESPLSSDLAERSLEAANDHVIIYSDVNAFSDQVTQFEDGLKNDLKRRQPRQGTGSMKPENDDVTRKTKMAANHGGERVELKVLDDVIEEMSRRNLHVPVLSENYC